MELVCQTKKKKKEEEGVARLKSDTAAISFSKLELSLNVRGMVLQTYPEVKTEVERATI